MTVHYSPYNVFARLQIKKGNGRLFLNSDYADSSYDDYRKKVIEFAEGIELDERRYGTKFRTIMIYSDVDNGLYFVTGTRKYHRRRNK